MWRPGLAALLLLTLVGCSQKETPEKYLEDGFIRFQEQQYDAAIDNYERAIALGAKSPNAYNMLGLAYRYKFQQTHDPKVGESELISFQKAVEIDPRYWQAMLNLGATYYARGDKVKAAACFKKAMEVNPQLPDRAAYEKMMSEGAPPSQRKPRGREKKSD